MVLQGIQKVLVSLKRKQRSRRKWRGKIGKAALANLVLPGKMAIITARLSSQTSL